MPWWLSQIEWRLPLTLGVLAAALTDPGDRWTGRVHNLLITLLCFCVASVSVGLLFPHPWAFAIELILSSWSFILQGALLITMYHAWYGAVCTMVASHRS